jgi:hypothetical protein
MIKLLEKQGRIRNQEFRFRGKGDRIRTISFSAEIIYIGGEPCIIATTSDISESREPAIGSHAAEKRKELERLHNELARIKDSTFKLLNPENGLSAMEIQAQLENIDSGVQKALSDLERLINAHSEGHGYLSDGEKAIDTRRKDD